MLSPAQVEQVWNEEYGKLIRSAKGILRKFQYLDHMDAEDVVQWAMMRALESKAEYRGDCSLSTLIVKVMQNHVLTEGRKRINHRSHNIPIEVVNDLHDFGESPFDVAYHKQKVQILEESSGPYLQVVQLRMKGNDIEEIAETLKMNQNTVKVVLHRVRMRAKRAARVTKRRQPAWQPAAS